ncbi:MAG: ribosomal protein L17 [uncultured bacterium]|uniref:50S ribosomal protein L17 n=1 Tax=Candidatus Curtissbacteria bacterium RIFOXYA1_FULL_41_14 TaxID=1797737 RepID=A0A1F5HC17_9BACT|nr:MAG: ribosomal protein L17 [uncultured bacterium]KKR58651.1 MAG: 50S ribosomal protein L17 [Candidatus Curtissbacteria bacterium GW2011_GWB1_40_28]KKR61236.1 MAG: 50S ribosomal protein L17 [Candidatus Curtissbacteria bacterium GW2011_GWA2_40_31]KKR62179.1 MAG: 50S ribosomal protein L17 [Microgenomates group bacterium GW2011_GWC1_40_35]KKR66198.1 MAG: 50S ribosomal protein L17 [Candidatus Curtissbacteria bacterium GW2011_GWA1_40_47]KKS02341.1 MAG: 50S ribosomal protein L17 [Candidatus Curtis
MRHARFGRKLNRDTNARHALLGNLTSSLFVNGSINTTLAKAKFARSQVEKLVTEAKKNRLSSNRLLASKLTSQAFKSLFKQAKGLYENRTSGFTRITKMGPRRGDNAPMARIELLDWKEGITENTENKKKAQRIKKKQRASVSSATTKNQRKSATNPRKSKNEKH